MSTPFKAPTTPSFGQLEEKYTAPFQAWKATPNPKTTGALLTAVTPDIEKGLSAHVGDGGPLLKSRARQLALQAFQSYDPSRARLGTHIVNQLQGLKRISRKQGQIISVPERMQLDQAHLSRQETELNERLGRDPTTQELADYSGISMSRIAKVRSLRQPVNEGYLATLEGDDGLQEFLPAIRGDNTAIASIVYGDLDPTNQLIMEHSLGLHGQRILSNKALAAKLRISPGAVTQRKAVIQRVLNQAMDLNPLGGALS